MTWRASVVLQVHSEVLGDALGVGRVVLVGLILMFVMGRSGGSDDGVDFQSVATTGGVASPAVATMDPAEAYVQQLIAQGYPEETARAYAAHYFSQQQ